MSQHLPTLRQLHYLVVLSEELHFGRAAERCFVTQSTLSAAIQELETTLQVTVVERTKRRVALTPLGHDLVARARRGLAEVQDLTAAARASDRPLTGLLRLGAIPTIGPYVLPRVLSGLRGAYPDLRLYLREEMTAKLVERLETGDLDVALIALPVETGELEIAVLADDPFWLALPPDHPLAEQDGPVDPASLAPADLLVLEDGHCLRDQALSACAGSATGRARRPAAPAGDFQATSPYTLIELVAGGLGPTLLPEVALRSEQVAASSIVLRPLEGRIGRSIALAWRRHAPRHAEFRLLAQFLRNRLARASADVAQVTP